MTFHGKQTGAFESSNSTARVFALIPSAKESRQSSEKCEQPHQIVGNNLLVYVVDAIKENSRRGKFAATYVLPSRLIGFPSYRIPEVAQHMETILRQFGYSVRFETQTHTLHVQW
jgi:hypothetical protein